MGMKKVHHYSCKYSGKRAGTYRKAVGTKGGPLRIVGQKTGGRNMNRPLSQKARRDI